MKLAITAEQAAKLAAREGDLDPTTGKPDYIPGFVPSAADRYYERRIERLRAASLETYLARQIAWSRETFGPAMRTKGIIDHIRKELIEVERAPLDLSEWADIIMIAMDGFWRHGGQAVDLIPAMAAKLTTNRERVWPDWRTMSEDVAIEHDRSHDGTNSSERCPACGGTRRMGPYFPGGLSAACGNCTATGATGGDHGD